jgi:tRNA(Ile2) C34 agmatinyltransferase TiaS
LCDPDDDVDCPECGDEMVNEGDGTFYCEHCECRFKNVDGTWYSSDDCKRWKKVPISIAAYLCNQEDCM